MDLFHYQRQITAKGAAGTSHPESAPQRRGVRNRPGILVIGHNLDDLEELLRQTEGLGIDVYIHDEILSVHYGEVFNQYAHFRGDYGEGPWELREEFESFNGIFLFTDNGIIPPVEMHTFIDRVYTTGLAGIPGGTHIPARKNGKPKDFSELIAHATRCMPPRQIQYGEATFTHRGLKKMVDNVG